MKAVRRPEAADRKASSAPSAETRDDYTVILLDWLNPSHADRLWVRDSVNKLLKNFRPRQQVALYVVAHESRLLHDFTSEPAELLQTLADTEEEPEDPFDPSRPPLTSPRVKTWTALNTEERIFRFNLKILDTIDSLTGRKSLIWITNGFPILLDGRAVPGSKEVTDYREYVEPLIDKINRANIAIYTVDPRGPAAPGYGDVGTLQEFSSRTGGTTFYARNDLDEGIRLALEDTKMSYTPGCRYRAGCARHSPGRHAAGGETALSRELSIGRFGGAAASAPATVSLC
jgi:VWFA-related protein